MKPLYLVYSDDFNGELLTSEAYNKVLYSMSTADYTLHRSKLVYIQEEDEIEVVDVVPETGVFIKTCNH